MDNKKSSKSFFISFFALIVSIAGVGVLGVYTYKMDQDLQEMQELSDEMDVLVSDSLEMVDDLQDKVELLELEIDELEEEQQRTVNTSSADGIVPDPVVPPETGAEVAIQDDNSQISKERAEQVALLETGEGQVLTSSPSDEFGAAWEVEIVLPDRTVRNVLVDPEGEIIRVSVVN
jgi:hypothetical protein